jgi:hypothetical protein
MNRQIAVFLACGILATLAAPVAADTLFISTGNPDGLLGLASRPNAGGLTEIEAADDFILTSKSTLTSATFTGLLPTGTSLSDISQVVVEIYRVFPKDSTVPPTGDVPTRNNSPSDVAFDSRDSVGGSLTFSTSVQSSSFTVANSILNGIHPIPGQTTNGEGAVTGSEVQFNVTFNTGLVLPGDHYFFVPQVALSNGSTFYWLSAPRPIVPPGTPFSPDLQSWIRNEALQPDWLRAGTDIIGAGTFNGAFSLNGTSVPEPSTLVMLVGVAGCLPLATFRRRRNLSPPG